MSESFDPAAFAAAVRRLERRNRLLTRGVVAMGLGVAVLLVGAFSRSESPDTTRLRQVLLGSDSVLELRGLRIVDAGRHTRVRLGAPLPGPIIGGQEHRRGAPVSGLLVYDGDGDERGGFAAADGPGDKSEVFIGLDSREGQTTLFLANPHDGGNLQVWDNRGNSVGLFAVQGAPFIRVARGDATIFEVPRRDSALAPPR